MSAISYLIIKIDYTASVRMQLHIISRKNTLEIGYF